MTSDELIKNICIKELQSGCFRHTIKGIAIYNYVQKFLRKQKCREYGFMAKSKSMHVDNIKMIATIARSTYQLFFLLLIKKNVRNFIYSFPRVDKVNGIYLDKFTDPVIDYSNIKGQGFVIFEKGKFFTHSTPRYHSEKVIYCDAIDYFSKFFAKLALRWFMHKYNPEFQKLWLSIDTTFPNITYSKIVTAQTIIQSYFSTNIYKYIFKRLSVVNFFAPGRGAFSILIPAAKQSGVKVFEIQHGITYGESVTYSGYRDPLFTPDYFLSFGDNKPLDVYGISPDKIINIGYAFIDYLNKSSSLSVEDNISYYDVLVVSEPHITTAILTVVLQLADNNPSVMFHFRPHPEEYLTDEQKRQIDVVRNIVIDDNRQNIMVVLNKFLHVIGENSTVLYEAASMGKKVGRLNMEGLSPEFLSKEDENSFYIISNNGDFVNYLNISNNTKLSKKIYSPFLPDVINHLINNNCSNDVK